MRDRYRRPATAREVGLPLEPLPAALPDFIDAISVSRCLSPIKQSTRLSRGGTTAYTPGRTPAERINAVR